MATSRKPKAPKKPAPEPRRPKPAARFAKPAGKAAAPKRGVHDLGGLSAGPIDRSAHAPTPFEERVDALMMLLTNQQGIYRVDSVRRAIESMDRQDYRHLKYYEKWIRGIRVMLVEQGVLDDAEIEARMTALKRAAGKNQPAKASPKAAGAKRAAA